MTQDSTERRRPSGRLVVVDDPRQGESLARILRQDGYLVDVVSTPANAQAIGGQSAPDAVLLDVALPGINGLDLLRRVRAGSDVPIIVVTAARGERDKIAALDAGADDYVTKPFSPGELMARIRVQLRQRVVHDEANEVDQGIFACGALRLDVRLRRLTRGGVTIDVSAREFDILEFLAQADGRVVRRQHLFARIWGASFYGDKRALDVYIHSIRRKIEPDPRHPTYLHTVRGFGYQLAERCVD